MNINVKNWKPEDGCKACKDAKRIIESHTRISNETNSQAIKKIKEQAKRIEELEQQLKLAMAQRDRIYVTIDKYAKHL